GIHRERAHVADDQRVSVGIGPRDLFHGDVAAAAGLVLDHELLAQALAHLGGEGARDDRGAAARRERYDQADRLGRVGLRERRRRAKRGGGERRKSRRHENSSSYAAARTEGSAFPRSWRSTNGRMPPWT